MKKPIPIASGMSPTAAPDRTLSRRVITVSVMKNSIRPIPEETRMIPARRALPRRLSGSREHLDDLAQEVFLRLYRALPSFRGEALLTTYLYRITVNVAQNEWKRRRRDTQSLVSISDETSGWEDRLEHPDRNAEEQ